MLVGICLIIIAWTANMPVVASVWVTVLAAIHIICKLSADD